jgi:imidazolonepropionase-like amidohydrolase
MSTLIVNGTLVDGNGGTPQIAPILVSAGRVDAVGEQALTRAAVFENEGRESLERVDATGLTVMPGLIDAHCHLAFDDAESNSELFFQRRNALSALVASYNARKLLRAGVTGILDPDSTFENMIDLRDAINAGVVAGPRMACGAYALITSIGGTAGRLIADSGVTGYYMAVNSADEIVSEVRRQIKHGADWIKVHVTGVIPSQAHRGEVCAWSDAELRLICATAHDLGTPVMGHCRGADATMRAAKAGFDLLLHATLMDEAALEAVIERKVPLVPTLTFQANLTEFGERVGSSAALRSLFERELADSAPSLMTAYREGVPLLCGSESGFSMVPYGHWHYREMEVFVRHLGMSPLEAISCATRENARALRMEGQVGVLAPGYRADLICVKGDPTADISVLGEPGSIERVMIEGAWQDLSPLPERSPLGGWRVASIGSRLTRDVAFGVMDSSRN